MSATDIKARYDSVIRIMVECGADSVRIAAATGTSVRFVSRRAYVLGVDRAMVRNAAAARIATAKKRRDRITGPFYGKQSAIAQAALNGRRTRDTAPEFIRILKLHRPAAAGAYVDADHIVACLHLRGLTLDDIHETIGIPPVEAVAAIRRAHRGHHP